MLWTEVGAFVKVPGLPASKSPATSHSHPLGHGHTKLSGHGTVKFLQLGLQVLTHRTVSLPTYRWVTLSPSQVPPNEMPRWSAYFAVHSSPLAARPAVPEPAPLRPVPVNAQSQGV